MTTRVGFFQASDGSRQTVVLGEPSHPLTRLRLEGSGYPVARALLEDHATPMRRRVPLVVEGDPPDAGAPMTLVVCATTGDERVVWVDLEQLDRLRDDGTGVARAADVTVAAIRLSPCYRIEPGGDVPVDVKLQYWNSRWEPVDGRPEDLWRIWPQGRRGGVRGEFAASLSPQSHERLGSPSHVVVERPDVGGSARLWARVHVDQGLDPQRSQSGFPPIESSTVALDSSLREALGLADGDFCRLHAWRHGSRVRRAQQRFFGARSVVAHVKIPPRGDLEKPICRLEPSSLQAIGARAGDSVVVETVVPGDAADAWAVRTVRLRGLEIDADEAQARAAWELPSGFEGFVDCSRQLGVFPPYPALYLDFHSRAALGGPEPLPVCSAVVVRTSVLGRLGDELSAYLWLAIAGLAVAAVELTAVPAAAVFAAAAALTALLLMLYVRRALR